jgi:ABC-type Na+ transport system ATPase subunit NatA
MKQQLNLNKANKANKANRCVILTTHDMEEADVLNDSIVIMKSGKVIAKGNS